jgi:hypothetical protein
MQSFFTSMRQRVTLLPRRFEGGGGFFRNGNV